MKVSVCVPIIGLQSSRWYVPMMQRIIAWNRSNLDIEFLTHGPTTTDELAEHDNDIRLVCPGSAIPSVSKNNGLDEIFSQNGTNDTLTSHNRNALAEKATGEWIFFIDYDTVPPLDALPRLLALDRPFCGGVYYHRNDPHMPLLYWRNPETGLYGVIADYEKGALVEVDATGMGCTLIHRQVFDDIVANYRQFSRSDGSQMLVHVDDIKRDKVPSRMRKDGIVYDTGQGYYHVNKVAPTMAEVMDEKPFPFFEMEHERTEDMGFCERAKRVGYDIVVDTSIECQHWHYMPITGDMFHEVRATGKIRGSLPRTIGEGLHGSNT